MELEGDVITVGQITAPVADSDKDMEGIKLN